MTNHPNRRRHGAATVLEFWFDRARNTCFWFITIDEGVATHTTRGASLPHATFADWQLRRESWPHGHGQVKLRHFLRGRLDAKRNRYTPINKRSRIIEHQTEAEFDAAAAVLD